MNLSKYFTLHEGIYLPKWKREATSEDGLDDSVVANLKVLFSKMDEVREYFGSPLIVHCAFRPQKYNELVGGAKNSAHLYGMAVDYHVQGMDCPEATKKLLESGLLDQLGLRMEHNPPEATWIHNDFREVPLGGQRYFKP